MPIYKVLWPWSLCLNTSNWLCSKNNNLVYVIVGNVGNWLPQRLAPLCEPESLEVSVCLHVLKPFSSAIQISWIQRKYGRILIGFYKKELEITGGILFLSLLTQFNKSLSPTINYYLMEGMCLFPLEVNRLHQTASNWTTQKQFPSFFPCLWWVINHSTRWVDKVMTIWSSLSSNRSLVVGSVGLGKD